MYLWRYANMWRQRQYKPMLNWEYLRHKNQTNGRVDYTKANNVKLTSRQLYWNGIPNRRRVLYHGDTDDRKPLWCTDMDVVNIGELWFYGGLHLCVVSLLPYIYVGVVEWRGRNRDRSNSNRKQTFCTQKTLIAKYRVYFMNSISCMFYLPLSLYNTALYVVWLNVFGCIVLQCHHHSRNNQTTTASSFALHIFLSKWFVRY